MKDLSGKILETIKQKQLKPKPKWQFLVGNYAVWTASVFVVLIGSLSVSILIHKIITQDWDIHPFLERSLFSHVMQSLPYIWLVLLAILIFLSYFNVRHTKSGYKYSAYWIVIGSVVVSLLLGGIFYTTKVGPKLEMALQRGFPFYQHLVPNKEMMWSNPDQGLIAGEIIEIDGQVLGIEDFNQQVWQVDISEAMLPSGFEPELGMKLKIVGEATDHQFKVYGIRPWEEGPFGHQKGFGPGLINQMPQRRLHR